MAGETNSKCLSCKMWCSNNFMDENLTYCLDCAFPDMDNSRNNKKGASFTKNRKKRGKFKK